MDCSRSQVELTNQGAEYTLNDCVLAYPVPPEARELLDLAGRWGKERIPQRQPWRIGVHLREGRKGRTGADAATLLHAGDPGFDFSRGEIWAVHIGWSGNHTHYAERMASGEQVIGGGELLLPGEIVLGAGESVHLSLALRLVRRRPRPGRSPVPPLPPFATRSPVGGSTSHPQRLGGGLLRP